MRKPTSFHLCLALIIGMFGPFSPAFAQDAFQSVTAEMEAVIVRGASIPMRVLTAS